MSHQQRRHAWLIHANANALAGHARLRYLKNSVANPILIADADLVISQSFDREVLAELSEGEIAAAQKALPVLIRVDLVDKDGPLLSSVTFEISLRITINVEFANHPAPRNRILPHGRSDSFAIPRHFTWQANVYG
jgi:hypothetical protein